MDRNFILAIVLSMAVIVGWDFMVLAPQRAAQNEAREAAVAAEQAATAGMADQSAAPTLSPEGNLDIPLAEEISDDDAIAAASAGRVQIDTPSLIGSINLEGGRIDDLRLKNYRETLDENSPLIRLLSPAQTEHGHYMQQGWSTGQSDNQRAVWTVDGNDVLSPGNSVTLVRRDATGLVFTKQFSVDDLFMFTVKQPVGNENAAAKKVRPYGLVVQRGIPDDAGKFFILHEGPIAQVGDSHFERKYKKARSAIVEFAGTEGWVGITNKYWLAAAVPPQGEQFEITMRNVGTQDAPIFSASYFMPSREVAAGGEVELTSYLFGGAKNVDILQAYEKPVEAGGLGIHDLDRAVDWGNFWFLTRPIFFLLDYFGDLTGNYGVAILLLTLVIKLLLFPLANKAYESMSKMKKLQPEMKKLQDRYKDDKPKLQQEMMALYQKEKMNPLAGCLPIIIQMPIFYALYKTLFVTIELRHEPFFGWIQDLSAPDPTTIFNLFGLLPYDPTALPLIGAFLGIGVLPLLMGVSMSFQMKLNPPAQDPIQPPIFTLMPIMFPFLFASFAAGLVLYWFWNTFLSILQQWAIMKKNGVEVDWGERLPFLSKKASADTPPPSKK